MFDILSSIVDTLLMIINFIIRFVQEFIYVIKLTGSVLSSTVSYFYFLPAVVSAMLISLITIAIVYKIAGRS